MGKWVFLTADLGWQNGPALARIHCAAGQSTVEEAREIAGSTFFDFTWLKITMEQLNELLQDTEEEIKYRAELGENLREQDDPRPYLHLTARDYRRMDDRQRLLVAATADLADILNAAAPGKMWYVWAETNIPELCEKLNLDEQVREEIARVCKRVFWQGADNCYRHSDVEIANYQASDWADGVNGADFESLADACSCGEEAFDQWEEENNE